MLDDSAFYQAETQMLTRENQMLRQRIRELGIYLGLIMRQLSDPPTERQLNELNPTATNSPPISSNLTAPPVEADAVRTETVSGGLSSDAEEKED